MRVPSSLLLTLALALAVCSLVLATDKPATKRILVLCTGNSARSQMAAAFLKSFDPRLQVYSAGTAPAARINPHAVQVMREVGIDISGGTPTSVKQFVDRSFDYVITVCDDADKNCPNFTGKVGKRVHIGFIDPAKATGSEEEILAVFRRVRDKIWEKFSDFNAKVIAQNR